MRGRIKFLITAALVLISAAALTYLNSFVKFNYCKTVVRLGDGLAILKEDDLHASVVKLDKNGNITDRVNILLNDPFTMSVKSVHDLFTDDNDNLYLFCTVYGPDSSEYETIYKCNFLIGIAERIWSSEGIDGYSTVQRYFPYIDGNDIYLPMLDLNKSGSVNVLKFSGDSYTVVFEDCKPNDGIDADRIIYRDGLVFCSEDMVGIFVNGEKIYPRDNAEHLHNAMNYDSGVLSFVDITENKILHYDIGAESFSEEDFKAALPDKLQNWRVYSDGTITGSCEDGEYLRGYWRSGGSENIISLAEGSFSFRAFMIFAVSCAIAAALIEFFYILLFVRIRKQKSGAKRYQSIAARITAISTAAGIVCTIVFGILMNSTVGLLNSNFHNTIDTNSSQFLAGYIFENCDIEVKDGMPTLNFHNGETLTGTIENYRSALAEKNGIKCSFLLFAELDGKLYRLGDQFDKSAPAEYFVSVRSVDQIKNSIVTGVNCTFEDKMTSGRLKYTCTNFPKVVVGFMNNAADNIAICTVSNTYCIRQSAFALYFRLIAVIFGFVFFLLLVANIVLRHSLSGLKRLRKAFGHYESKGEPSVFLLPGGDEISETGQALMLMTEGTRVHTRDIREGNRKYKRLIAAGVLKMMGQTEISKVNFGDYVCKDVLIMRFLINNNSDVDEYIKLINGFIEESGGMLLNFCGKKADVCFTDEEKYGKTADMAARLGYPFGILVSFGTVEAGSAGSDRGAWLIALSKEFGELDNIEWLGKSNVGEQPMICTKKAADRLKSNMFLSRCELLSESIGDTEYFYIIPQELGEENEYETIDNNTGSGGAADDILVPVP